MPSTLDVPALAGQMLAAALPLLQGGARDIEGYARAEFLQIAQRIASIGELLAEGRAGLPGGIGEEEAALLMDMQKHASRSTLTTVEGLGLVIAENAINAALGVVRATVNTAIGFALL